MGANENAEAHKVLLDAGARLAEPMTLDPGDRGGVSAVVPNGHELVVKEYDLTHLADRPRQRDGVVRVRKLDSWLAYWAKHAGPHSEVYADVGFGRAQQIVGVLDAHGPDDATAGWRRHRVVLVMEQSPEWKLWVGGAGKMMGQVAFAEHIEQGLTHIVHPDAADMLEIAQTLQGATSVQWESAQRLTSGEVRFRHTETIEARAGQAGDLEIPQEFTLLLRPWLAIGTEADGVQVKARFRYRIQRGEVGMGYVLTDLDRHVDGAAEVVIGRLGEQLAETGKNPPILHGTPA